MPSNIEIEQCRDRWQAALATGDSVPQLARNAFVRVRQNILQIGSRLTEIGYPLVPFIRSSPSDLDLRIMRIENHTGLQLPAILKEFWQSVGGISLVDIVEYRHVEFWERLGISGAHQFCDGVYIDACDDDWAVYTIEDFDNCVEDNELSLFQITLAPDGYHKDDISGGSPYAIGLASDWEPKWENFRWAGYKQPATALTDSPDFLGYLRTAVLECAGFPGLYGHPKFEKIRLSLIEDLEPF